MSPLPVSTLKHQHETLHLLRELSAGGMTVIVSIHDLNLALKYCTSFMILDGGRLYGRGRKGDIQGETD